MKIAADILYRINKALGESVSVEMSVRIDPLRLHINAHEMRAKKLAADWSVMIADTEIEQLSTQASYRDFFVRQFIANYEYIAERAADTWKPKKGKI